tara:strand:+ start:2614 stop:2907 length:294 start_codon:yes stop_codon:yes gene_type:complete
MKSHCNRGAGLEKWDFSPSWKFADYLLVRGKGELPRKTMENVEMERLMKEVKECEAGILMFVEHPEHREAVADGLVDLRRVYSNIVQLIAETCEENP